MLLTIMLLTIVLLTSPSVYILLYLTKALQTDASLMSGIAKLNVIKSKGRRPAVPLTVKAPGLQHLLCHLQHLLRHLHSVVCA